MCKLRSGLWFAAAAMLLTAPDASAVEALLPPQNSAAAQYTEAIPTGGGDRSTEGSGRRHSRTPRQILGAANAERLEAQGATGRAAAELASETAPSGLSTVSAPDTAQDGPRGDRSQAADGPAPPRPPHRDDRKSGARTTAPSQPTVAEPSGSPGFGSVLAHATGTSADGELGAFLPLAILATVLWAILYVRRERRGIE